MEQRIPPVLTIHLVNDVVPVVLRSEQEQLIEGLCRQFNECLPAAVVVVFTA